MQSTQSETQEESIVSRLLFKYLPYWPVFVLFVIVSVGIAYVHLRYTNPKYEATATLIIKDEKKGYENSEMIESLNVINTKKIIENEVEVMQSRTLMDTVVKTLHLYAPQFEEGKINTTSAYLTCPLIIEAATPDDLTGSEKIYVGYNAAEKLVSLNGNGAFKLNNWVNTPYGLLKFSVNNRYKAPTEVKPVYFILVPPKEVAQSLLANLTVTTASKLSTIIDLSFKDEVPNKAEDVLNELIRIYSYTAINEKNNLAKNTLALVEERLKAVVKDLDSIEQQIQIYKAGRGAIDISTQGQLFLANVSTNDQKLSEVNMQLSVLDQVENFVKSKNSSSTIVPSTLGISDPGLSQLLEKLYVLELEYEKLKGTVAENNPLLISVADQIIRIRPGILDNIQSQRRNLAATRNNLNNTNSRYNSMLQSIPAKERQLLDISRDQAIMNGIYSFLLQKREESALSFSSTVSDSRIVDRAQASTVPVSPNRKIVYLTALFAALALSIAIVTMRELMNSKVLYRQELESLSSFPILGEVAYGKSKDTIVIKKGKRTLMAEEFRRLRISLPFLGIGEDAKKLLITSSIPGEGKSFIAANLAISLSLTGKKVVLVDFDLNNPSLGELFGISKEPGVSEFLTGQLKPEEIIKKLDDYPSLFFVPSGSLPESPSELIANGTVKELLAYLDKNFDFVVIDSAPVMPVTDAYLLTGYCNATIYVVRHKYTPKAIIKRLDEKNKINGLSNPAIVFNGVMSRGFLKNKFGYGYGYGYIYEDGKDDRKKKSLV